MMYKFGDSIANNPMVEIFRRFALHDEVPFQAMLAIASKHRAGVEGKKESVQSLTHKMRALRLMNERIQSDSKGQLDGTIYAVATMAVIEVFGSPSTIIPLLMPWRNGRRTLRSSACISEAWPP
jgi:hypothetical protein